MANSTHDLSLSLSRSLVPALLSKSKFRFEVREKRTGGTVRFSAGRTLLLALLHTINRSVDSTSFETAPTCVGRVFYFPGGRSHEEQQCRSFRCGGALCSGEGGSASCCSRRAVHVTPTLILCVCWCPLLSTPTPTTPQDALLTRQGAAMDDELVCVICKGAQDEASNITQQKLVVNNKCGHRL